MKKNFLRTIIIATLAIITAISLPILTNGQQNTPIAISSEKDFSKLTQNPYGEFYLTNDITFSNRYTIEPNNSFSGIIDGRGHTVFNAEGEFLIAEINDGEIKNLQIENCEFSKAGIAYRNYGTISNCRIISTTMSSGICYSNRGLIVNCYTEDTDGPMCIMNSDDGIIKGCINLSDVSTGYSGLSESSMGGIAAKNVSIIENCINKGNICGSDYVGGICGLGEQKYDSITNCANYGSISGSNHAYGIGQAKEVSNCINFGKVKGNGSNARGIGGYAYNCVNIGEVNNGLGYAIDYLGVKSQSYALSTSGTNDYYNKTILISKNNFNNQSSFNKLDFDSVWKIDENGINLQNLETKPIGISIYALPDKTSYYLGEDFDQTGLKIIKFNSFGNWELTNNYSISDFKGAVGKNTITVTCGDYSEKFNVSVNEDITNSTVTFNTGNIQYANGYEICPDITVISPSGRNLVNGRDYTVTYKNNISPGTASLYVEGIGYNTGNISKTFVIKQKLTQNSVILNQSSYIENGSQIIPDFSVYNCVGTKLTQGVDYNVTFTNNVAPGQATLTITGIGYYENTLSQSYTIYGNIANYGLTLSGYEFITNSNPICPTIIIVDSYGKILIQNVDYSVTYNSNIYPGIATVSVNGIGNYIGTLSANYRIKPSQVLGVYAKGRSKNSIKLSWANQIGVDGYIIQKYDSKKKSWTTYKKVKSNSITISKLSSSTTYKFRIRSYKGGDYGTYSKTLKVKTLKAKKSSAKTTNNKSSKPSSTSKYSPKKVNNVKAIIYTHHSTNQFKVTWNKSSKVSGYQIEYYGENGWKRLANINSSKKNGYVSNWANWSLYMPKAKVRIRAFKTVNGKKYYSSWSNAKMSFISK